MKRHLLVLLTLCALLSTKGSFAQPYNIDSLQQVLRTTTQHDTDRVLTMINVCRYYQNNDFDSVKRYANIIVELSDKTEFAKGQGGGHIFLGLMAMYEGDYPYALSEYDLAYGYYEQIGMTKGMANCLNNNSIIYSTTGQYDLAADNQQRALEMYKQIHSGTMVANSLNNMGLIYVNQERGDEAYPWLMQAIDVMQDSGFTLLLRSPYTNLGIIYQRKMMLDSAVYYFNAAIPLYEEAQDYYQLGACYSNMALVYDLKEDTTRSLEYNRKSMQIRSEIGDLPGIAISQLNIGVVYRKNNRPDLAIPYIRSAIRLADSLHIQNVMFEGYMNLAQNDSALGHFDSAFIHMQLALLHRDSMIQEEIDERLANMRVKYDTDEIQKQKDAADVQLEKEKTIRTLIIWGSAIIFLGLILLAFALRAVRKKNTLLGTQRQEILTKNYELEFQNNVIRDQKQEITDSINYAYNIQQSLLPSREELKAALPDSFVMFRPKDIISGDFYLVSKVKDSVIFIVADCTGHGVPGAMMSMLGVEEFQKAIALTQHPGEIIAEVNRSVKSVLKQSVEGSSSRDGMDVAVCVLTGNKLQYAGAHRPLWICRKGELTEQKATKVSVGGITPNDQVFETHDVHIQFGDMIYLTSDGFADQFGGETGKKMMTKNMKQFLCSIYTHSTADQKKELETLFQKWKGTIEQVDDVCVLGVRI